MDDPNSLEIQLTQDGSHTFFSPKFNDCYHSRKGAIQESKFVFIDNGLKHFAKSTGEIVILEYGFGTGLNAILSLDYAISANQKLNYISLEAYPLSLDQAKKLNYTNLLPPALSVYFHEIHQCSWEQKNEIHPFFSLQKRCIDFISFDQTNVANLIYFDAFAPNNHPEAWTLINLRKAFNALKNGGLLTTYCAKGQFKRDLKSIGFKVESIPGPPGKREMTLAWKK